MKFTCSQGDLLHALNTVNRVVSTRTTLPVLNNVLIEAKGKTLTLSTTNLEIAIQHWFDAEVQEEGAITIPVKLITQYIALLDSKDVSGETTSDHTLHLKTQHASTTIKGIAPDEFPLLPTVDKETEFEISAPELNEAVSQTAFAAAMDGSRPVLSGVFLRASGNTIKVVATDSYRLAEKKTQLTKKVSDTEVIIPGRTVLELSRILAKSSDMVNVVVAKNQVLFLFPQTKLISRSIEGQYPPYEQIIPATPETQATLSTSELATVVKRVSLFTHENAGSVKLKLHAKGLTLTADTDQVGSEQAQVPATVTGPEKEVAFNARYITEALGCLSSKEVTLGVTSESSPGLIKPVGDESYLHVIMPLKL